MREVGGGRNEGGGRGEGQLLGAADVVHVAGAANVEGVGRHGVHALEVLVGCAVQHDEVAARAVTAVQRGKGAPTHVWKPARPAGRNRSRSETTTTADDAGLVKMQSKNECCRAEYQNTSYTPKPMKYSRPSVALCTKSRKGR